MAANTKGQRGMDWRKYIKERKEVMMGKPVFKGTRLTVEHILEELGSGMSIDDLLDNYPTLKPQHVRAAMQYAAAVVALDQSIYEWRGAAAMKYLADENIARRIVEWLRSRGDDLLYASEERVGEIDAEWLREAEANGRLILTSDKDFGDLIFCDGLNSHGVVLFRLES